jgi:hypothetical protein
MKNLRALTSVGFKIFSSKPKKIKRISAIIEIIVSWKNVSIGVICIYSLLHPVTNSHQ